MIFSAVWCTDCWLSLAVSLFWTVLYSAYDLSLECILLQWSHLFVHIILIELYLFSAMAITLSYMITFLVRYIYEVCVRAYACRIELLSTFSCHVVN